MCARRASGAVVCWGLNDHGQIGDGSTTNRTIATPVFALSDATMLTTGDSHNCAVRSSGQIVCWGLNATGELGDGTFADRLIPTVVIGGPTDVVSLSAGGRHTCAVRATGAALCWGVNEGGELGSGGIPLQLTPAVVVDN